MNYSNSSDLNQKKDDINCAAERSFVDEKFLKLSSQVDDVNNLNARGYIVTERGYKVHKSCMDRWGAEGFPKLLKTGMNLGMQCLADLAQTNVITNATPNGAKINLENLKYLQQSREVTIVCDEDRTGGWAGVSGHASTLTIDKMKNGTVKFPFISLNPNDPKIKLHPTLEETNEMMSTIFHEQLHNLGFRHGSGVEFPYTCEVCCISNEKAEQKEAACKVCAGAYLGNGDKNYVKDMISFMRQGGQGDLALKAAMTYLKEVPNDRFGILALADASTDTFSPMGMQMSLLLKNKFKDLTDEEKAHFQEADKNFKYGSEDLVDPLIVKLANFVAQGYVNHYYDHNTKRCLSIFGSMITLKIVQKAKGPIKFLMI